MHRSRLLAAAVFALCAPWAQASLFINNATINSIPTCGSATNLQQFVSFGWNGCSVGEFSLQNFRFETLTSTIGFPSNEVATASEITVLPPASFPGQVKFSSNDFFVTNGRSVTYRISYFIDPPPEVLPGFDIELNANSPSGGGFAEINANVCAQSLFTSNLLAYGAGLVGGNPSMIPNFGGPCAPVPGRTFTTNPLTVHPAYTVTPLPLQVSYVTSPNGPPVIDPSDGVTFAAPVNLIDVRIEITLNAGTEPGGTSQIRGLDNVVGAIPEPSTYALMGTALAALAALRRRRG
ncbi:MAG: PEP-CTERM sorting domain-containing protein [Bryobacter sp.]|nr:PEP-CTERM sorting domain-containing protein [Bryobacter sp.]